MTTYVFTPDGLMDKSTGIVTPFNRNGRVFRPQINTSDDQEPTMSMADGKYYTSKAKMRESYKPGGNPQGATFVEVGDDQSYKKQAQMNRKPDEKTIADSVDRAFADLNNGRFSE